MRSVEEDYDWAKGFESEVEEILREHLSARLVHCQEASEHEDMKEATDLVSVESTKGRIAVRIRRPTGFRDLTIRSWRRSGMKTELAKLREGFADFYFYGWCDRFERLAEWMIVDLDVLRKSGLLESAIETKNYDGKTGFISISLTQLNLCNALIAKKISSEELSVKSWCIVCMNPFDIRDLHQAANGMMCSECLCRNETPTIVDVAKKITDRYRHGETH